MAKHKGQHSQRHTPLKKHKKVGSSLVPPLAGLPLKPLDWDRDLLPEYLWIASLRAVVPTNQIHRAFYTFMDAVAEFWPAQHPAIGLLTDFRFLQPAAAAFLAKHHRLIRQLFLEPFGRILSLFPDSPASWLVSPAFIEEGGHLDPERELNLLRSLVVDLLDGSGQLASAVRMPVFGRIIKSGKMYFPRNLPVVDLLIKYPDGCSVEERGKAEAFARTGGNAFILGQEQYKSRGWPSYFWRHNADLLACRPRLLTVSGGRAASPEDLVELERQILNNTKTVRDYLDSLALQVPYDLYAPETGEILHGLFARCIRLYLLMSENPSLWARDISGILLRCLVETAITFCYLAEKGSEEDFRRFREYGEGQKKLLMLHLQDSHPEKTSLEGRSVADLAEELGFLGAEAGQIELGHWSKQDARKLAEAVDLQEFYRLVFSPTSADVHGTWASLRDSNLCMCAEPLHGFHRMPTYMEPPLFVGTLQAAQSLLLRVHHVGVKVLHFPDSLTLASIMKVDEQPMS
jgi:hypothetical protein